MLASQSFYKTKISKKTKKSQKDPNHMLLTKKAKNTTVKHSNKQADSLNQGSKEKQSFSMNFDHFSAFQR